MTELADTLVRDHQLPFKAAHAIAARLTRECGSEADRNVTERLDAAAVDVLGRPLGYSSEALKRILSPRYFVEVRRTLGWTRA